MPIYQSPQQKNAIVPTPEQVAAFLAKRRAYWAEHDRALLDRAPAATEPPRSNVRPAAPIEWLWPGRIARGKLTVITGAPGSGKSILAMRIAAAVSSGAAWPCGEGSAVQGRVVLEEIGQSRLNLISCIRQRGHRALTSQPVASVGQARCPPYSIISVPNPGTLSVIPRWRSAYQVAA